MNAATDSAVEQYKARCQAAGVQVDPRDLELLTQGQEHTAELAELERAFETERADRQEMASWQAEGDPAGDLAARVRFFGGKGHELETAAARTGR